MPRRPTRDNNPAQRTAHALPKPIRTRCPGIRPTIRTVAEGLRLIDLELPQELKGRSRWTFARKLLEHAARTGSKRDIATAARQLTQALGNEGWLAEDEPAGPTPGSDATLASA